MSKLVKLDFVKHISIYDKDKGHFNLMSVCTLHEVEYIELGRDDDFNSKLSSKIFSTLGLDSNSFMFDGYDRLETIIYEDVNGKDTELVLFEDINNFTGDLYRAVYHVYVRSFSRDYDGDKQLLSHWRGV